VVEVDVVEEAPAPPLPTEIQATYRPTNAVMVSTSTFHRLAVTESGDLWGWGQTHLYPVWIMGNIAYAVAGGSHDLALAVNGDLWAWGQNSAGQVGDGTLGGYRASPVKVMENVIYAAVGRTFSNQQVGYSARSFAITDDYILWGWGGVVDAIEGFIGDGTAYARAYPVQIMENVRIFVPSYTGGFVITHCETLWGWGFDEQLSPIPLMENVAAVSLHHRGSVLAITTDGTLWKLDGEPVKLMENVVQAQAAYPYFIFALTTAGDLYTWGQQELLTEMMRIGYWDWRAEPRIPWLGNGTRENSYTPTRILQNVDSFIVEAWAAFAITRDRTLWAWGNNHPGWIGDGTGSELFFNYETGFYNWRRTERLSPVAVLEDVVQISSRFTDDHGSTRAIYTFAVTGCGALWAWGGCQRGFSMLGDGTNDYHLSPVRIF